MAALPPGEESCWTPVLRCAAGVNAASSIASGLQIAIEAAMGAVRKADRRLPHGDHRHLHQSGDTFTGSVKTLNINANA